MWDLKDIFKSIFGVGQTTHSVKYLLFKNKELNLTPEPSQNISLFPCAQLCPSSTTLSHPLRFSSVFPSPLTRPTFVRYISSTKFIYKMKIVTLNSWVNLFLHKIANNYFPLYSSALYSGFFNLQQWCIVPKTKELQNIFKGEHN